MAEALDKYLQKNYWADNIKHFLSIFVRKLDKSFKSIIEKKLSYFKNNIITSNNLRLKCFYNKIYSLSVIKLHDFFKTHNLFLCKRFLNLSCFIKISLYLFSTNIALYFFVNMCCPKRLNVLYIFLLKGINKYWNYEPKSYLSFKLKFLGFQI